MFRTVKYTLNLSSIYLETHVITRTVIMSRPTNKTLTTPSSVNYDLTSKRPGVHGGQQLSGDLCRADCRLAVSAIVRWYLNDKGNPRFWTFPACSWPEMPSTVFYLNTGVGFIHSRQEVPLIIILIFSLVVPMATKKQNSRNVDIYKQEKIYTFCILSVKGRMALFYTYLYYYDVPCCEYIHVGALQAEGNSCHMQR